MCPLAQRLDVYPDIFSSLLGGEQLFSFRFNRRRVLYGVAHRQAWVAGLQLRLAFGEGGETSLHSLVRRLLLLDRRYRKHVVDYSEPYLKDRAAHLEYLFGVNNRRFFFGKSDRQNLGIHYRSRSRVLVFTVANETFQGLKKFRLQEDHIGSSGEFDHIAFHLAGYAVAQIFRLVHRLRLTFSVFVGTVRKVAPRSVDDALRLNLYGFAVFEIPQQHLGVKFAIGQQAGIHDHAK
jgi:hypothetical protein